MPNRLLLLFLVASALSGSGLAHEDILARITALDAEISRTPDPVRLARRADLYRRHRDWSAALRDYDLAASLAPDDPAIAVGRARVFLDSTVPEKALEALAPLLAFEPEHGNARLLEARAYAALGETEQASVAFDRALSVLEPPLPEHFLEHAEALATADPPRLPEAIRVLDAGIAGLGDLVSLHGRALEWEQRSGNPDAALARTRRVLATSGAGHPSWLLSEAEILAALHRIPEAREALAQLLARLDALPSSRRNTPAMRALSDRAAALGNTLSPTDTGNP